jgi:hypothetical protein
MQKYFLKQLICSQCWLQSQHQSGCTVNDILLHIYPWHDATTAHQITTTQSTIAHEAEVISDNCNNVYRLSSNSTNYMVLIPVHTMHTLPFSSNRTAIQHIYMWNIFLANITVLHLSKCYSTQSAMSFSLHASAVKETAQYENALSPSELNV